MQLYTLASLQSRFSKLKALIFIEKGSFSRKQSNLPPIASQCLPSTFDFAGGTARDKDKALRKESKSDTSKLLCLHSDEWV
jgi:hypothetical protein